MSVVKSYEFCLALDWVSASLTQRYWFRLVSFSTQDYLVYHTSFLKVSFKDWQQNTNQYFHIIQTTVCNAKGVVIGDEWASCSSLFWFYYFGSLAMLSSASFPVCCLPTTRRPRGPGCRHDGKFQPRFSIDQFSILTVLLFNTYCTNHCQLGHLLQSALLQLNGQFV